MSQAAVALGELLAPADRVIDSPTSYLIGQLAAELITSASDQELRQLIVATQEPEPQHAGDRDAAPSSRQTVLAMLSGFLQGLLADRRFAATADSPLTVRERVLNLLAIGPHNPSSLSAEIGCSMATTSRALRRLRQQELVDSTPPDSGVGDRRHVMYQLTAKGEKRQDDHFLGQLTDETEDMSDDADDEAVYHYSRLLERLTEFAGELNQHDAAIAEQLSPTLNALKERVESLTRQPVAME
ncbi:MAG: ArsR/SmtB family transcription factor [Mycobacterium sp.]